MACEAGNIGLSFNTNRQKWRETGSTATLSPVCQWRREKKCSI